jgi:hypothetical protein
MKAACVGGMVLMSAMMCVVPAFGQQTPNLTAVEQENARLRERVDKLENELGQIKALLTEKGVPVVVTAPAKKPVVSGLDLELYGYIKLDAAYDNARVAIGDYAKWVEPNVPAQNSHEFNLTANQTRLGLKIKGPEMKDLQTRGLVEIDFYGGGAENKPNPMMRHAYLAAYWPDLRLDVLAGQTADTISPLTMPTLNYTVGWWQGNIGYRRPQLRVTETAKQPTKSKARLNSLRPAPSGIPIRSRAPAMTPARNPVSRVFRAGPV